MRNVRVHVFIEGRVQGISYRYWTKKTASSLGLTGWVKNLAGGRVEAVFEGQKKEVEQMIKKCRRGPILAGVKHIDIVWEDATGEFKNYEIVA
ncbi:MAG: acylphosphatase [Patescibacteria group bacterium]